MSFTNRLATRIALRQAEKGVYSIAEAVQNNMQSQFPTLLGRFFEGVFTSIGLSCWFFLLALTWNPTWSLIISTIIGLIIFLFDWTEKKVPGLKQKEIQIPDRRYKVGYRVEYEWVKDRENCIKLEKRHIVYNRIGAVLILLTTLSFFFFYFVYFNVQ